MTEADRPHPWPLFSMVRLTAPAQGLDGDVIPAGKDGAIVEILGGGKAYEVDLNDPFDVATVPAEDLILLEVSGSGSP